MSRLAAKALSRAAHDWRRLAWANATSTALQAAIYLALTWLGCSLMVALIAAKGASWAVFLRALMKGS